MFKNRKKSYIITNISIALISMFISCINVNISLADYINSGLIAFYPFNGNANDETENNNNGVVFEARLTEDRNNVAESAYIFDGINDYIIIENNPIFNVDDIAIELWIKVDNLPSETTGKLLVRDQVSNNRIFQFSLTNQGELRFIANNEDSESNLWEIEITTNNTLTVSIWYHVIVTFANDAGAYIYVNGEKWGEDKTFTGPLSKGTAPILIGGNNASGRYAFNGKIDEIRIYNRALSENECVNHYLMTKCNYSDLDSDGVIDSFDKCDNTSPQSYVDKFGCSIDLNNYYTQNQLEQAVAYAITEKNQIINQKENTIIQLNNTIESMFTEDQLNSAVVSAILEKQQRIDQLEIDISNMFTQVQVDEAVLNAKKGLYKQEQVEIIINKILEWDTNNDGVIG